MCKPILSICIPTRNRASNLQDTLEKITSELVFQNTNKVQIVISDNCSDDATQSVCLSFLEKYPNKIIYKRQTVDILDKNFIEVLKLGEGKYLKLNNDNIYFFKGELEKFVNFLEKEFHSEIIFISNSNFNTSGIKECKNIDELLSEVSFFITWIGGFCINKELYETLENPDRYSSINFAQVDIILRLIEKGNSVTIYGEYVIGDSYVNKKGGYNVAKVFGVNYLSIIDEFYKKGLISSKAYNRHKKELLKMQINRFCFNQPYGFTFENDKYFEYLIPIYGKNLYFYIEYIKCRINKFFKLIIGIERDNVYRYIHIMFFTFKVKRNKGQKGNVQ